MKKNQTKREAMTIMTPSIPPITGLFGCSCHPFTSWNECDFFHRQDMQIGDRVLHRCTGKVGTVIELKTQGRNKFVIVNVDPGKYESNKQLEHVANLIKL